MRLSKTILGVTALALALTGAACGDAATNANMTVSANTAAPNVNTAPSTNAAPASPADTGVGASVREPERYRATYVFSAQTTGAQTAGAATTIEVARDGQNRRWAFDTRTPMLGKVVILDRADKRYLILEGQKRYLELTPQMTGFNVPRTMTPGMMVEQMQRQPNVEKLSEEQVAGRTAVKYRVAGQAATGTPAGEVKGESFFWIDKETGLPLKAQGATAASGQVQGASGATGGMEVRELTTTVDPATFELPTGFTAMSEQEVRQLQQGAGMILQAILGMMGGGAGAGATATPAGMPPPPATPAR